MKTNYLKKFTVQGLIIALTILLSATEINAQSYLEWYKNAQERIDTLRKGDFGFKIIDNNGQEYTGPVSVRMAKHEFPFGIAFDFYEGTAMGNSYTSQDAVSADTDAEIYQTERWGNYLAYDIPVESGKAVKVNFKFAEIYFDTSKKRVFDVSIDGKKILSDFDVFAEAGGKNIAIDTAITFTTTSDKINIEFIANIDNPSIKAMEIEQVTSTLIKINCGGPAITTKDGNKYVSEDGFFAEIEQPVASNEQWMQAAMYKYFNYGVSGNSFKWSGIQPQHTAPNYTNFENAVKWTQKAGWDLRAHTLLWGNNEDHEMPAWVRELETPEAITDTCKMRVIREVSRYKGIIKEYDVINEALSGHADWLRNTVGDSILWNCFKWAHAADPDAQLYINDYNVELNWGQAVEYRDLVKQILDNGGPVSGIGIQAHFWDCCRPNINEVVKNFDILAETGLPLRLTEYDWGSNLTEEQQVDDFVMIATIAFSHPSVNGMICWGLSDVGAWRENSGFFDSTYRPKLAADTLLYYTKQKWATNFDSELTSDTPLAFNAYYGDYTIEVDFNGTTKVFTIPCLKANEDSVFTLYEKEAVTKGPQLLSTDLDGEEYVILTFDKAIDGATVKKSDFKFFSNYKIGIDDIQYDAQIPEQLVLVLSTAVTKGDYISVSYFPGDLLGEDGSKANPFGPEGISNAAPVEPPVSVPFSENDKNFEVYPNPAKNNIVVSYNETPYQVSLYNSLGAEVYSELFGAGSCKIDVSQLNRGVYLVKITPKNNESITQKLILD